MKIQAKDVKVGMTIRWGVVSMLVDEVGDPTKFGVVEIDSNNKILKIVEKPQEPKSNLISTGVFFTNSSIFDYGPPKEKGEYFLATAFSDLARENDAYVVKSTFWMPIGYPEHLKKAEEFFKKA